MHADQEIALSVLIVTYNSAAHLRPTLEALFAQEGVGFEAILLDNASADDSLAVARGFEPRGLRVVACAENLGYAGGNNAAAALARGRILVLLNPDAVLDGRGALAAVECAFAARPRLGVLGGKILSADGRTIQHLGGRVGIPAHAHAIGRDQPDAGWDEPLEVEFVIGALLAIPTDLWRALDGFDEFFNPAYYEDTDLCWRARRRGRLVLTDPAVRVLHQGNVSTAYKSPAFWWMHHKGRLWFTAKNLPLTTLLLRAAPAELAWFASANARYHRRLLLGLYGMVGRRFVKRRLLRAAPLHERRVEPARTDSAQ